MCVLFIAALSTLVLAAQAPKKAEPVKPVPPAVATKDVKKPEVKPVAGGFVGNKDSKTIHKADCKFAAKMKEANKVAFASKEEAEKQGYKACKACLK
jgi:hypothetical protein